MDQVEEPIGRPRSVDRSLRRFLARLRGKGQARETCSPGRRGVMTTQRSHRFGSVLPAAALAGAVLLGTAIPAGAQLTDPSAAIDHA